MHHATNTKQEIAGYFLYMLQRVLLGPLNQKWAAITEMNKRELFTLVPLMILVIVIGVYPLVALEYQAVAINALIQKIGRRHETSPEWNLRLRAIAIVLT